MKPTILLSTLIGFMILIASCKNKGTAPERKLTAADSADTAKIIKNGHLVPYTMAKTDSANFAIFCKDKLKLKQDPLRFARLRLSDMLEAMGIWNKKTIDRITDKQLGVIVFIGWDKVPKTPEDTVQFHLFLQPVKFNYRRDSIEQFLYFNAYRQIVDNAENHMAQANM